MLNQQGNRTATKQLLSGFFAMFKALFGRKHHTRLAHALYGLVVARSRDQKFYSTYSVPDSFDGRFEMLVMHLFMLHHRLKDEDDASRAVSQRVFDAFIDDMDSALREAAVGDQTVPKRIAKMTQVFYGRTGAYENAFQSSDPLRDLKEVIARNLHPDQNPPPDVAPLAAYMLWQYRDLAAKSANTITEDQQIYAGPLLDPENYRD